MLATEAALFGGVVDRDWVLSTAGASAGSPRARLPDEEALLASSNGDFGLISVL
jgi:hypothetical protein